MDIDKNQQIHENQSLNIKLQSINLEQNKSHQKKQRKTNHIYQKQNWSKKEIEVLFNQYLQNGTCWSQMKVKIPSKSGNNIKNKFNNLMRTTSKLLRTFQSQVLGKKKDKITKELLLAALEISNQVQRAIKFLGLTLNWESKFFSFKSEILKLCLRTQKLSNQRIENILRATSLINIKMRSYLVFKQKNIRNWKISGKAFNHILSFDKIITENIVRFPFQNENERIIPQRILKRQGRDMIQQLSPLVSNFDIKILNHQLSLCHLEDNFKEQNLSVLFSENNCHYFYP